MIKELHTLCQFIEHKELDHEPNCMQHFARNCIAYGVKFDKSMLNHTNTYTLLAMHDMLYSYLVAELSSDTIKYILDSGTDGNQLIQFGWSHDYLKPCQLSLDYLT